MSNTKIRSGLKSFLSILSPFRLSNIERNLRIKGKRINERDVLIHIAHFYTTYALAGEIPKIDMIFLGKSVSS